MRKLTGLTLILALILALTGCVGENARLNKALEKMQDITSMESSSEINFKLETTDLTEQEKITFDQVSEILNNLKITMDQKTIGNKEKTKSESETKLGIELSDFLLNTQIWSSIDIDEFKALQVVKVPQMLSFILPELNKEYLVYDLNETMKASKEEIDLDNLVKTQKELQTMALKFIKDIQKDFNPGFKIVSLKESRVVDKEKVKVYEMKLDDKTLKELGRLMGDHILNNEAFIEFLEEYGKSIDENKSKEEIQEGLTNLKEEFNGFMDKIKDVQILGEKGINIQYSVNKQGYIIGQAGNYDFQLNLKDLLNLGDEDSKGKIDFKINYKLKNFNINNKDIKIDIPIINIENSQNILDLIQKQLSSVKK